MTTVHRTALFLAVAGVVALSGISRAHAADTTKLTLYRSDNAALYASNGGSSVDDGYAVVHEQRTLKLLAGTHDMLISGLPDFLDPEALALNFPGADAKVVSQRLLLARGANAALTSLIGHDVEVLGSSGQTLTSGNLLRADGGLLVRDPQGRTTLVTQYAAVRSNGTDFPTGSSLSLRVVAAHDGTTAAMLSYPTAGLGWRAAYVATLQSGTVCRMQFESRASIANRSGRDWSDVQLSLIAGEPNMAKPSGPRPMMAIFGKASLPQQDSLGDYRSFALPARIDLPDGSVSQVPLYANRTLDCTRTELYENGNNFQPQQPQLNPGFEQGGGNSIMGTLQFKAFDSLPAGYLRVLSNDRQGTPQFIGEGRINDTPKGSDASITLGTAFDLRGKRTRTHFSVDKAGHTLDEAFRITLSNAGENARTVTVREHPSRWQQWTLTSSSSKPSQQTPDTLEFRINVPTHGEATLDYAVRYRWTAAEDPQP